MTILTDDELKAVRERDLRHRDGRTLMKDVAEGGRDRRALLRHIDALQEQLADAREAAMQDCWNAVDDLIVTGHLDESWRNEQRNGLVLATNAITALIDRERKAIDAAKKREETP